MVAGLNLDQLKENEEEQAIQNRKIKSKHASFSREDLFKLPIVDLNNNEDSQKEVKEDPTFEISYTNRHYGRDAPDFEEKCLNMTGKEIVFYLLESTHLGNAVSFYLNMVKAKEFRPYDLITVPKSQVFFLMRKFKKFFRQIKITLKK